MELSKLAGAALLSLVGAGTAHANTWTPAPKDWDPKHRLRIVIAYEPSVDDKCGSNSQNGSSCTRQREDIWAGGEKRSVYRHAGLTRQAQTNIDHLNYLFQLSNVPIQAELADAFRTDRECPRGTGTIDAIKQDLLLTSIKERTQADDVIAFVDVGKANTCGLHYRSSTGKFQPYGYVTSSSNIANFGCGIKSSQRTFAHEVGHGMGLAHNLDEANQSSKYARGGATWAWVTTMSDPGVHGGLITKNTWSDPTRKCDAFYHCGGQNNDADAARYLRENAHNYRPIATYSIRSTDSMRRCIDATTLQSGSRVLMWDCHGGANQTFTFHQDGSIRVGGLCLDVAGGRNEHLAPVVAYQCHGGTNQKWAVEGNGTIRSQLAGTQRCLDVAKEDGNALSLWECTPTSADQRFTVSEPETLGRQPSSAGRQPLL